MNELEATSNTPTARARPPRVWPSILALFGILPVLIAVLGVLIVAAAAVDGALLPNDDNDKAPFKNWFDALQDSPQGVLLLVLPGQLVLLAAALAAASLSRLHWRERLALEAPRAGGKVLIACLLGTLSVGFANEWLVTLLFPEPSEALESISKMLIEPRGLYGVLIVFFAGVVPGVCEELFFRGYAQSRLVARWGGLRGLVLPSLFFAALHFDPQHMLGVLPIGFWLGFVAWRTSSTWTSMLCHAFNNIVMISIAKISLALSDPSELENARRELDALTIGSSIAGIVVTLLAMRVVLRNTTPATSTAAP